MADKKVRGFGSYILMFVGLAIAVVVILFGVMIISPNVEIFGLRYLNASYQETLDRYGSDGVLHTFEYFNNNNVSNTLISYVSEVVIESDTHDVEVRSKENVNKPYVERTSNFIGFFKTKNYVDSKGKLIINPLGIQSSLKDGVLKIKLTTPDGLVFSNSGKIIVTLPANYLTDVKLKITTTKGTINLGGVNSAEYTLQTFDTADLDLSTETGNITLRKYVGIKGSEATITTDKGKTNIYSSINNSSLNLRLNTKSGVINADQDEDGAPLSLMVKKLDITSTLSDIKFSTVTAAGGLVFNGTSGRFYADDIESSLTCGNDTEYTDFHIKKITGKTYIPNGKSNSINIDEATADIVITGEGGVVNIKKSTKEIKLIMKGANVNINEASDRVSVETTSGKVNLVDCKNFSVKTGKGAISLSVSELSALSGDAVHSATSGAGAIFAEIKNDLQFNLKTEAKGTVSIELGSVYAPNHKKEETTTLFNGGNGNRTLWLKTGNKISVVAK